MIDDLSTEEYSNYLAYGENESQDLDLQRFLDEFLEDFITNDT